MKRLLKLTALFIAIILFIQLPISGCKKEDNKSALILKIQNELNEIEGKFALAYKDVQSGETILINENERFHAASTMKTPVMIELFKQANEGKFSITDSILIIDEFYSIVDSSKFKMDVGVDSEAKLYDLIGKKLPISELMYEMITMSSNLATNILIDLVDARKVTQSMRSLGADSIMVLRGVEDLKAFDKGLSNTTTALDLLNIYDHIANGTAVNPEASKQMINVLSEQYFSDMIPKYLPEDVTVAHKTGSITGVHHDSGIVMIPDGNQYILVILSKELGDFDAATDGLAKVSKLIYDYHVR